MTAPFLVTGVTGQDGGYLVERLLADGQQVHGIVRGDDPLIDALTVRYPELVLHRADLADADAVRGVVEQVGPDAVVNLGGISSVAYSWQHPTETAAVTGLGAVALLEAATAVNPRVRFVQASSAEIFGEPAVSPQNELTPIRPVSPYGVAKAFAHQMCGVFRARGTFAATCILYNHESPRRPPQFVTRKITQAAARISLGLQDTVELGHLHTRRDWGWAPDYVDALVRVLGADEPDDFVVATGVSHSLEDFVATAFAAAGIAEWRDHVRLDPALVRPADASEQRGDPSKIRSALGWEPTKAFDQMVREMVAHDLAQAREGR